MKTYMIAAAIAFVIVGLLLTWFTQEIPYLLLGVLIGFVLWRYSVVDAPVQPKREIAPQGKPKKKPLPPLVKGEHNKTAVLQPESNTAQLRRTYDRLMRGREDEYEEAHPEIVEALALGFYPNMPEDKARRTVERLLVQED